MGTKARGNPNPHEIRSLGAAQSMVTRRKSRSSSLESVRVNLGKSGGERSYRCYVYVKSREAVGNVARTFT